jgi:hypothetical protein
MKVFASSELQRNPAEIQKAALMEPVFLSDHDKPRYVMMSLEEYVRLKGASVVATPESFPESVMEIRGQVKCAPCPDILLPSNYFPQNKLACFSGSV